MKKNEISELLSAIGIKTNKIETNKIETKKELVSICEKSLKNIKTCIDQHERHKSSFFWSPPQGASSRRRKEKQETWSMDIGLYSYSSGVSCSCKKYYYKGLFTFKSEKTTLKTFKRLESLLSEAII